MELHECTFATGAVILNYAAVPSPTLPLVLLHGGNARWQLFESILPDLAASWHLYALEFRGHGRSGWVKGSFRLISLSRQSRRLRSRSGAGKHR